MRPPLAALGLVCALLGTMAQAKPPTAAALQGTWCWHETQTQGQSLPEKAQVEWLPQGRYSWSEPPFQLEGRWSLKPPDELEMSQHRSFRILLLQGDELHLGQLGGVFKFRRGNCAANSFSGQDRVSFHNAAASGDLPTLRQFLERGMSVNLQDQGDGDTALIKAAKFCRPEAAQMLLARGAELGLRNQDGQTALDYARNSRFHRGCAPLIEALRDKTRP